MPILHHPFLSYLPGWLHSIGCFGNFAQLSCENQLEFRGLGANSFGAKSPSRPAFPKEDVAMCRAVREAVGDDMVLMLDPWGVYIDEIDTSAPRYLHAPRDPMDDDGNVLLPDGPDLGYELNWDYINEHRVAG